MSDTTKTILWIALALIVIAIVILLVRSASRRRQEEARRREATSLRAQARAAGERARGNEVEASRRAAKAAELADEAKAQEAAAAALRARQESLAQRADRIDPDVPESAEGAQPRDEQRAEPGRPAPRGAQRSAAPLGLGLGAPDFEDDEPDLADADNPFGTAPHAGAGDPRGAAMAQVVPSTPAAGGGRASSERAPGAGDFRAVPEGMDDPAPEGMDDPAPQGKDDLPPEVKDDATPESDDGPVTDDGPMTGDGADAMPGSNDDATSAPVRGDDEAAEAGEADWVNGPVDEAVPLEEAPTDDDVVDWINGPEEAEPVTIEVPDRSATEAGPRPPGEEPAAGVGDAPVAMPHPGASDPAGDDTEAETAQRGQRLVSRLDEVTDGGHGVGSAAPIADGAQPLGHPVKAWRDTMTYVMPGGIGYEGGQPDVWFDSEQAARAAGFRPGGAG